MVALGEKALKAPTYSDLSAQGPAQWQFEFPKALKLHGLPSHTYTNLFIGQNVVRLYVVFINPT